jgi:hypothetical protein
MDMYYSTTEATPQEEIVPGQTGRPPPIVITVETKLMQLKKVIKSVAKENFEFRNARNGTRVITKILEDFAGVKSHLETKNLPYFTFYPMSLKCTKSRIRNLPVNASAENISDGMMDLD